MTEKQLSDAIYECATLLGWRGYHTYDSRRSNAGFPDWVYIRSGHLIFAELKTATGTVSPAQQAWLDDLLAVSIGAHRVQVYTWRPSNWLNGDIEQVLRYTGLKAEEAA
jgi:hypothetical protein